MTARALIDLGPPVAEAFANERPLVALESTIITHGMPYPKNLETALMLEAAVTERGAVPATIAVIEGRFRVGLDRGALESLARLSGGVVKASRRDLAAVVARGGSAGTTVAATMFIAELAGLEIFATGGIGGVHRGAEETFDISADLVELSRTRLAVVCAGAKSILDIGKTLEYLESQGVAVCGFRCDEFPAFFARSSGHKLDHRFDGARDLARMVRLQRDIGPGGVLIANPIPEAHALDADAIERRIGEAVAEARAKGIEKKAVTPFLLGRIVELTEGRSLEANMALVKNNAMLAADVAVELARLEAMPRVLVVGDVMTDIVARLEGPIARDSDTPASIVERSGGSAATQAVWLARAGVEVVFVARVGAGDSDRLAAEFAEEGVIPWLAGDRQLPTGRLIALVEPNGERSFLTDRGANDALALTDIPGQALASADWLHLTGYSFQHPGPRAVALELIRRAKGIPISVDPGSAAPLRAMGPENFLRWTEGVDLLLPNADEAAALTGSDAAAEPGVRLAAHYPLVVIKRGAEGAEAFAGEARWSAPAPATEVLDTTGAGDAFVAAFLAARLAGARIEDCLARANAAGAAATTFAGGRPPAPL